MEASTVPWATCAGALQLFRKEMFPNVRPDPLLVQRGAITSHPINTAAFSKPSLQPQQVLKSRFGHAALFAGG